METKIIATPDRKIIFNINELMKFMDYHGEGPEGLYLWVDETLEYISLNSDFSEAPQIDTKNAFF